MRISGRSPCLPSAVWILLAATFAAASSVAAQDSVSGSFTIAGKAYKLSHVNVRRQPSNTDESRTVFVILLTDVAVPANVLSDRYRLRLTDLAREGKIHGVSVTVGADRKPIDTSWNYAKEIDGAMITGADHHTFDAKALDDSHAEGKLTGQGAFGDNKWEYSATFKAAVTTLK